MNIKNILVPSTLGVGSEFIIQSLDHPPSTGHVVVDFVAHCLMNSIDLRISGTKKRYADALFHIFGKIAVHKGYDYYELHNTVRYFGQHIIKHDHLSNPTIISAIAVCVIIEQIYKKYTIK